MIMVFSKKRRQNMDKPLVVARAEFVDKIVNVVNESGLPAFVMREVFDNVRSELNKMEQVELEAAGKAWTEAQMGEEVKKDECP